MKFEYDDKEDRGECVAELTSNGNLMFAGKDGERLTLCRSGLVHIYGSSNFGDPPKKKLYKGDKITITL